jgi:hypothetical protein
MHMYGLQNVKSNSEGMRVLLLVLCGKWKDRAVIFGAQSIAMSLFGITYASEIMTTLHVYLLRYC